MKKFILVISVLAIVVVGLFVRGIMTSEKITLVAYVVCSFIALILLATFGEMWTLNRIKAKEVEEIRNRLGMKDSSN
jgi:hypothetical protein